MCLGFDNLLWARRAGRSNYSSLVRQKESGQKLQSACEQVSRLFGGGLGRGRIRLIIVLTELKLVQQC